MKLGVFGSGYVGLVTATCFAEMGNHIWCVDIDADRVADLNSGKCPIYEPGLEAMLAKHHSTGHLKFSTDADEMIRSCDIIFIAVGTPAKKSGEADLKYVLAVANDIGEQLQKYKIVVNKSTVPIGSTDQVREVIQQALDKRGEQIEFDVVSNPEFLKESCAVEDCIRPDRIVIGSSSGKAIGIMRTLYAPFNRIRDKLIVMDERSAEMTKYAANAMLATKISFMNEMSRIADAVGADIEQVRGGIGADKRIGAHFIYAGAGYGGSCFPKDIRALIKTAAAYELPAHMLRATHKINEQQKQVLLEKILQYFEQDISGKTFALWGLGFKPGTDDIREAPSRAIMKGLWANHANVAAYDPKAMPNIEKTYGERSDLTLCDSPEAALEGADALIVVTEWHVFRSPDFDLIKTTLRHPVIFDGRNLYDPDYLQQMGIQYYGVGRCNHLLAEAN